MTGAQVAGWNHACWFCMYIEATDNVCIFALLQFQISIDEMFIQFPQ